MIISRPFILCKQEMCWNFPAYCWEDKPARNGQCLHKIDFFFFFFENLHKIEGHYQTGIRREAAQHPLMGQAYWPMNLWYFPLSPTLYSFLLDYYQFQF
jgi:hypothetical protein